MTPHATRRRCLTSVLLQCSLSCVLFIWSDGLSSAPREADAVDALPDAVRQLLDSNFPGWRFTQFDADTLQRCGGNRKNGMTPSLIWGDFNGDKVRDYAVYLQLAWRQELVIALSRSGGHSITSLQQAGGLLTVLSPGSSYYDHDRDRSRVTRLDTIVAVRCEQSAVAFIYEDGRFIPVVVSD